MAVFGVADSNNMQACRVHSFYCLGGKIINIESEINRSVRRQLYVLEFRFFLCTTKTTYNDDYESRKFQIAINYCIHYNGCRFNRVGHIDRFDAEYFALSKDFATKNIF